MINKLTEIYNETMAIKTKLAYLDEQFLCVAKKCKFNKSEGTDEPECCHEKQEYVWCDATTCPFFL